MIVLCGLGNPGEKYAKTRHNFGFLLLDFLASCFSTSSYTKKFSGDLTQGLIGDESVLLFKPMAFMNLSGNAVAQLVNFYKIVSNRVLVVHDDVDLEFADIRIKKGGSSGGHNGLKSIDQSIGKDYWRVRFGIGRDSDLSNYVLSQFSKAEFEKLEIVFDFFKKNITSLIPDVESNKSEFIKLYKASLHRAP